MSVIFVKDREVGSAVLKIIEDARQEITLVSPFNHNLQDLIAALKNVRGSRGVKINRYYHQDKRDPADHFGGVASYPVADLHAKIYANESTVLVTSFNLNWGSWNQNREVGLLVRDTAIVRQVREYVESLGESDPSWVEEEWDDDEDEDLAYEEPIGRIHVVESEWHYDEGPQRRTYTSCGRRIRRGWEVVRDGHEWENMLGNRNARQQLCRVCIGPNR